MTILDYAIFEGRHYETGSVHNLLRFQGYNLSEMLLLGISGGVTCGYFSFAYEGYDPHVAILTRNTFNPFDRMLERIGAIQDVYQTQSASKATENLERLLDSGQAALVWVDMFSLPYFTSDRADDMYMMIPLVVYGKTADTVYVADRSGVPLTIDAEAFLKARGVVKKTRYKILAIDAISEQRIPSALEQGLHDCIGLFTGKAPKATRSFGAAGMQHWARCLTKTSERQHWSKVFPVGPAMYAGLTTTYASLELNNDSAAERLHFAQWLEQAADLLNRPALAEVAQGYRTLAPAWTALANAHLPDSVPLLAEARFLMQQRKMLFVTQGLAAQAEREAITQRLRTIRQIMQHNFPLDHAAAEQLRLELAERILALHDQELAQINALTEALKA